MDTQPIVNRDLLAVYQGQTFRAGGDPSGRPDRWKLIDTGQLVGSAELTALYQDRLTFTWRGQPFSAWSSSEDSITGVWIGYDLDWARAHLDGNQYDGFDGTFKLDEVRDLVVERTDYLTGQKERRPLA